MRVYSCTHSDNVEYICIIYTHIPLLVAKTQSMNVRVHTSSSNYQTKVCQLTWYPPGSTLGLKSTMFRAFRAI